MNAITKTNVISAEDYRNMALEVLEFVGSTICRTLGPCANTSIIEEMGPLVASKDGFHTLTRLRFAPEDIFASNILKVITTMSHRMVNMVGDGSSSAVVGAWKFATILLKKLGGSYHHMVTRPREMNEIFGEAIENICAKIEENAQHPSDENLPEIIYQTALVSTNGDNNFAELMRQAYIKTDNGATFNIVKGKRGETESTFNLVHGYKANYYYMIDPIFFNFQGEFVGTNVYVICFDMAIDIYHYNMIHRLAMLAHMDDENPQYPNEVIVVAPSYSQNFLDKIKRDIDLDMQAMGAKSIRHFRIRYMRCLSVDAFQRNEYMDFCMLTGSTPITAADFNDMVDIMKSEENFDDDRLKQAIGKVKYLKAHGGEYTVIDGFARLNKERFEITMNQVKEVHDKLKIESLDMRVPSPTYIHQKRRLQKLQCKMVELIIGAQNEFEMNLKYDAAEDATLACESVAQYGYTIGQNLAIILAATELREMVGSKTPIWSTYGAIRDTFVEVLKELFANKYSNAGYDNSDEKTRKKIDIDVEAVLQAKRAYNLVTEDFDDSIINSPRTDIEILRGAVSICLTLMTANQYIMQIPNVKYKDE